jgi:hypothetical protein
MIKTKDVLIFVFALFMIFIIGFGFYLLNDIQKNYKEIPNEVIENKNNSKFEIQQNPKLMEFLENPIDLKEFKKQNNRNVTTTVTNGKEYYYYPIINDSIFYSYNFIADNDRSKGVNEVIVFKFGKNKHTYDDETEILIELRIINNDTNLGRTNLIGFSKSELRAKFGSNFTTLDEQIIYSVNNKVLIFVMNNEKVESFYYSKLANEKIDRDVINKILKK